MVLTLLTKLEASKGQNEKKKSYSNVFGEWLVQQAEKSPELMAITPAMREGSDLIAFSEQFPERYFDVAIAEQHAVTLAAGLACEGMKPVVAIYSTFCNALTTKSSTMSRFKIWTCSLRLIVLAF